MGLIFVVLYMSAALGLLITTSFLGLRRYLRQRYLRMPAVVALSWLKLGGGVAAGVLAAALLLPRPGANQVWTVLRYQIDYRLQQASQYAAKGHPPGQGEQGRAGQNPGGKEGESKTSATNQQGDQPGPGQTGAPGASSSPPTPASIPAGPAGSIYQFLRLSLMVCAALFAGWWLFRCRYLLWEIARSLRAAIVDFFRNLLDLMPARRPAKIKPPGPPRPQLRPLAEYKNPFYADAGHSRPPSEIILYTYDAVQAWAREQGIDLHPEQTAREFCRDMAARAPELAAEYRQLSNLHAHAAYGRSLPAHCDLEPLKELWRQLTWNQANAPAALDRTG